MHWFFICLAIGFFVVEIASGFKMYAIWPSFSALIIAVFDLSFENFRIFWQAILFLLISIVGAFLLRPLFKLLALKIKSKNKKSPRN